MPPRRRSGSFGLWMILFFLCSRLAYYALGVRFDESPLTTFWQNLDVQWLRTDLARSLFYLHSQPPLWNLFLGLVLKAAPQRHLVVFWAASLLLGFALYAGLFGLMVRLGVGGWPSFLLSSLFAATPAFVLHEHCLFYALPVSTLLVVSALLLDLLLRRGGVWAALAFFASLLALASTWALFHLAYLLLVTAGLALLAPRAKRAALLVGLPALLLLGSLYAKNLVVFGDFAATSWTGMNLARITVRRLPRATREALVREGVLSAVARIRPFAPVTEYPGDLSAAGGFAGVACLTSAYKSTGQPNLNHVAYVAISALYLRDALTVVAREPRAYLSGVREAWFDYGSSATESSFLEANREAVPGLVALEDRLYGRVSRAFFEREGVGYHAYPLLVVALALAFGGGLRYAFSSSRVDRETRLLALYLCFSIAWVALFGNSMEVGENNRFRFATDPLSVALLGTLLPRRTRVGGRSASDGTP